MDKALSPIVIFAYKRKDKIEKCFDSLKKCRKFDESKVYIFSDGYRGINDKAEVLRVRDFLTEIESIYSNVEIIKSDKNKGLSKSIIEGVTDIINQYGKIIVLEDDLIVSEDFIEYMNKGLMFYENKKEYGMISSYTYPLNELKKYDRDVYAVRKGECWGWATWIDRWKDIDWELKDFDDYLKNKQKRKAFSALEYGLEDQLIRQHNGQLDAWAARWLFHLFNKGYLTIYPSLCRSINIGNDSSGENCGIEEKYDNRLYNESKECEFTYEKVNEGFEKAILKYSKPSFLIVAKQYIKNIKNSF